MSRFQMELRDRKGLARQAAKAVWRGAANDFQLGVARRCVESLLDDGVKGTRAIVTKAIELLKAGWMPVRRQKK